MLEWMNNVFWGARIWIWLYLLLSFVLFLAVIIYFYKELIRKKYYEIFLPEQLIKIVMHYPSNMFKEYWRLIPDTKIFNIGRKIYNYNDKNLIKTNDNFLRQHESIKPYFEIEGHKYYMDELVKLKKRFTKYPEIHYFFNVPSPINFKYDDASVKLSSEQLEIFKENDLFNKLLSLENEKKMLMLVFLLCIINFLVTAFILAKIMGWLEPK